MSVFSIVFGFQDSVSGNGFRADVHVQGHALVAEEDGAWWVYGVRPAGLAGTGESPGAAYLDFRGRYRGVLFDIAEEAADFQAFAQGVLSFFDERDESEEARWEEAVAALRAGTTTPSHNFLDLPRVKAETRPPGLKVIELKMPEMARSSDNAMDRYEVAAA